MSAKAPTPPPISRAHPEECACLECWPDPSTAFEQRPAVGPGFWSGVRSAFAIELAFVLGGLALARALGWWG